MAEAADKPKVKVRFYRFHNRLKEKAAGAAGYKGTGEIPAELLAKAEEALEKMSEDYPDWVSKLIDRLGDQHRRCVDTPEKRRSYFEELRSIAHDMRGQGGTFGYPLISEMAESLYQFTGPSSGMSDNHVEIIKAHVDAMRVVIKNRIKGDAGDIGIQLMKSLHAAIKKYEGRG
jgi:hypothetical protein